MPTERISMRSIREVLRLRSAGLSLREIGRCLRLSKTAVGKYLELASSAHLTWPLPDDLDDSALERRLSGGPDQPPTPRRFAEPDCARIHQELKRKGVTLRLLWEEYRDEHPEHAYQLTQFSDRYREFRLSLKRSMRQTHTAGEKLFVDYAGQTVPVLDHGQVRHAQVFVAVLGASNYTYAEATWSQASHDWVASNERALLFIGGSPALLVPDNLKAGVEQAHRYEPKVNRTYEDFARHYGTAVLPARPYKPKDKAKVETGVLLVSRWILARLRDEQFLSLEALNARIFDLVVALNERPFRSLPGSRRSLFEQLDKPALLPLPESRFVYGDWARARVGIDYHVSVDSHAYSVPHALVRKVVDLRVTGTTVEIFHGARRVASHLRSSKAGGHSTHREHMPASHRAHAEWTPQTLLVWAALVGESTARVVERMLEEKPHPEQGYRACLGLRSLSKKYGSARLEAACRRAVAIDGVFLRSIESILSSGLDSLPLVEEEDRDIALRHENVRGPEYYRGAGAGEEVVPC
jgi:transposase